MKKLLKALIVLFLVASCRPQPLELKKCNNPTLKFLENKEYKKAVDNNFATLILNEGGFTYGNASISSWDYGAGVKQNIFKEKNNYNIGDVLQSAYKLDDSSNELYLIVNNSQKIEVVDYKSFERIKTITGFTSPRYMTTIGDIALVTDLYANAISVFKTSFSECELEPIKMKGWTEQIFTINNKIYVIERSEVGASTLFANLVEITVVFDDENNPKFTISKRTSLPLEPQSVVLDSDNNIWILCSGKESENVFPTILKFNTSTNSIEKTFTYNSFVNIPQNLCYANNSFYYNQGKDIYKLEKDDTALPLTKLFSTTAQNIYGLSNDSKSQLLLVLDAKDYVSNGEIFIYYYNGDFYGKFQAGIIPSKVLYW